MTARKRCKRNLSVDDADQPDREHEAYLKRRATAQRQLIDHLASAQPHLISADGPASSPGLQERLRSARYRYYYRQFQLSGGIGDLDPRTLKFFLRSRKGLQHPIWFDEFSRKEWQHGGYQRP